MAGDPTPNESETNQESQTQPNVTTNDKGGEDKTFNIADLPKEAWAEIYKSDRFKQLNEKAKQAETVLKEKAEAEKKALEEQGEWQKLAENARSEVETLRNSTITSEIKAYAAKLGAVDLEDVAKLADRATVKFENGVVTGAEDVVKALAEAKPHLFNSNNQQPSVSRGTNPGNANNQGIPKFVLSQTKDPAFWREHEAEILQSMKNGTLIDDTK